MTTHDDEPLDKLPNPFVDANKRQPATIPIGQAREVAEVQAAMAIAQRFPRNEVEAMDRIINACTRFTLAESALYEYARGGTSITGPSIRLAEVIAQNWGHIHSGVRELSQANGESTVEAFAWDTQTGSRDSKVFQVRHWRDTKQGGYKIEDGRDIYELVANMGARRKRACILAVIPGDVVERAVEQCEVTLKTKAQVTPDRLKEIVEVFGGFGVPVAAIEKRLQRHIDTMTPGQMLQLRKIANSIRDGMSTAADWFELEQAAAAADDLNPPRTATQKAKDAAKKAQQQGTPPPPAQTQTPPDEPPLEKLPEKQETTAPGLADVIKLLQGDADAYNKGIDLVRSLPQKEREQATIIARQERKKFTGG